MMRPLMTACVLNLSALTLVGCGAGPDADVDTPRAGGSLESRHGALCVAVEALVSDGFSGPAGPVLGYANGEVLRVSSGGQSILTDNAAPAGSPYLDQPTDMAFLANGDIVLTDSGQFTGAPKVVQVNKSTGARTLLSGLATFSSAPRGSGPALVWPSSVAVEASGDLLVVDVYAPTWVPRILRISPTTGDRTIMSSNGVGTGPALASYVAEAEVANIGGVIYLINGGVLMSVDPANGDRTLISGSGRGGGPTIIQPLSIANGSTPNTLMILDELQPSAVAGRPPGAMISVNLTTGDRTVFSTNGAPNGGQQFDGPYDMVYDGCQNVYYVLQPGYVSTPPGRVIQVDGVTGVRTLYADFVGARNWSLLMTPILYLPGGGTTGGGGKGGGLGTIGND